MNLGLKEKAILFRKEGYSYSEILSHIPVSKSTLSLWLRDVNLTKRQFQRLSDKKREAALRGSQKRKDDRIYRSKNLKEVAQSEIGNLSYRELWLIGIALYWAEGSKEKEYRPSIGAEFINSDPRMIKLFLRWLKVCNRISSDQVNFRIYIHESSIKRLREVKRYWSSICGLDESRFEKFYLKKHNPKIKKIPDSYFGLLKVTVQKSSSLVRKVDGWVNGINYYIENSSEIE